MGAPLQSKLWNLINFGASDLCGDYAKASPKSSPRPRLVMRLLVACLFILGTLSLLVLCSSKASGVRSVRYYGKKLFEKEVSSDSLSQTYCPCKVTKTRWSNYTAFYMLERNSSSNSSVPVTKDVIESLCNTMGFRVLSHGQKTSRFAEGLVCFSDVPMRSGRPWESTLSTNTKACPNVMQYCFGMANNELLSQQLMAPSVFPGTLGSAIQQSCTTQQRYYKLLLRTEALENNITGPRVELQECRSEECIFEPITRSLLAMHKAFQKDPENPSDDYFWNFPADYYSAAETPTLQRSRGIAFKMTASWDDYMSSCDPAYCDVVEEIGPWRRIFNSVAQFGGTITIMLVGLRVFFWPMLVWICAWDRFPHATASVRDLEQSLNVEMKSCDHQWSRRKRFRTSKSLGSSSSLAISLAVHPR